MQVMDIGGLWAKRLVCRGLSGYNRPNPLQCVIPARLKWLRKIVDTRRKPWKIIWSILPIRSWYRCIKTNWENYHYCLGRAPTVELSIGRYLTWFVTKVPDHFMNLVDAPPCLPQGFDELIEDALAHFRSLKIRKLAWHAREGTHVHGGSQVFAVTRFDH